MNDCSFIGRNQTINTGKSESLIQRTCHTNFLKNKELNGKELMRQGMSQILLERPCLDFVKMVSIEISGRNLSRAIQTNV